MLRLLVLFLLVGEHGVWAATELLSWQLDGNSRSAWDILWSCATSIFACTWTILHSDVPGRQISEARRTVMFARTWLMALFVPELILGYAFEEFVAARSSRNKYNAVQTMRNAEQQKVAEANDGPTDCDDSSKWTLTQTFCVNASGLSLLTPDDWIYNVRSDDEMVLLIQTGLVSPDDMPQQEIEDHAKQDWLGKLFTFLQVTWFFCNTIARWASQLSVSPLELATFAYCILAMFVYLFWWYKPKDISSPITIPLHCNRDDLPTQLLDTMDAEGWMHRRTPAKKEHTLRVAWQAIQTPFLSDYSEDLETVRERVLEQSKWLHVIVLLGGFMGIAYSGIHLAAWVPTPYSSFIAMGD
ncbi:hypothetical protein N7492_007526 [Penicillium capsulatum]|uniref:Uncharacterized protein n=1 Tax=Penicillium capsulatum TaxID=69766 RepID=A0A9W9HZZ8_9EURO|nr:hypothetical protein N7492_007526 [Penicillium capsulatum]KAJ6117360.1 hypothetical protein N7512_007085 [Penicillium capsulatum]